MSDNLERYNVEITITPEDAKFTERCEAAGLPLAVISMYKPALKRLVADEREACAEICDKEQEFIGSGGPYVFSARRCATNIRARGDK